VESDVGSVDQASRRQAPCPRSCSAGSTRGSSPDEVVIRAGCITRAGIPAQPGIEVADGRGGTLVRGLIDAHAHPVLGDLARALVFGITTGLDMFSAPGIVRRRGQEAGDQGREQARAGRQLDVAAVVDVQRRVRDARG